jgi:hypothetical protein
MSKKLEVELDEKHAAAIEIASLRVESAQNALAARRAELEVLAQSVKVHYSENGKFSVTGINLQDKKVSREAVAEQLELSGKPS